MNTDSYRFFDSCLCPFRCHKDERIGRKMVSLADATHHTRTTELCSACSRSPPPPLNGCRWILTAVMVTLITEQLRKQSLEEPYDKALNVNVVSRQLWQTSILVEYVSLRLVCFFFFFSLCLQWVLVPPYHGALAAQHKKACLVSAPETPGQACGEHVLMPFVFNSSRQQLQHVPVISTSPAGWFWGSRLAVARVSFREARPKTRLFFSRQSFPEFTAAAATAPEAPLPLPVRAGGLVPLPLCVESYRL